MRYVSPTAKIAAGTDIGYFTVIGDSASIGSNVTIGNNVTICPGSIIGDNVYIEVKRCYRAPAPPCKNEYS
jgi:UDP-3-O-[3-hydroxymyristoyl] glucosamine N-acyltransferase